MISDIIIRGRCKAVACQVIACRCQAVTCQVIARQTTSAVDITIEYHNARKQYTRDLYKYIKIVPIKETDKNTEK